jgi:hypothetical protein
MTTITALENFDITEDLGLVDYLSLQFSRIQSVLSIMGKGYNELDDVSPERSDTLDHLFWMLSDIAVMSDSALHKWHQAKQGMQME